ncbi:ring-1,2-phenylacetyl-CoA epoxidase subunit PaaD [Burkholderiales bacterium]|nr:ring-1,2-phenylacetyl-CoA epoxidase subunit PaaD [Burkholderiales bacterium]
MPIDTQRAVDEAAAPDRGVADLAAVWLALAAIPDPEIPVVSIVDLGIVRAVAREGAGVVVRVTPTYSGCPATELIFGAIRDSLAAIGLPDARVEVQLAPAWTTDWIAADGKRRLREYGIAPPGSAIPGVAAIDVRGISPLRAAGVVVPCPRCGSTRTRLTAQFGSTACKALYRCDECLEPFDYFKPH